LPARYLLACEALHTTKEAYAFTVFESVFKQFGLPKAIRTDNGVPFSPSVGRVHAHSNNRLQDKIS
jgi:putative transposase